MGSTGRIAAIDNLKGVLIFLVVFGHLMLPVYGKTYALYASYRIIYLFHMPLFIFVSGFLAKSIFKNGRLKIDKIISMAVLAIVYKTLIRLFDEGLTLDYFFKDLLYFSSVPWYLFSLATWYCMVPVFKRIKPIPAISLSFVIALLVGFYPAIGKVFSISRTFVYLPYFLLGYYCNREQFLSIKGHRALGFILCSLAVLITLFLILNNFAPLKRFFYLVYCDCCYDEADLANGFLGRVCFFCLAIVYSLALIFVMPQKNLSLISYLGEHTLQIYVLHRFVRIIFDKIGFYNSTFLEDNFLSCIVMLVVTIITIALCLIPIIGRIIDSFMRLKWKYVTQE